MIAKILKLSYDLPANILSEFLLHFNSYTVQECYYYCNTFNNSLA